MLKTETSKKVLIQQQKKTTKEKKYLLHKYLSANDFEDFTIGKSLSMLRAPVFSIIKVKRHVTRSVYKIQRSNCKRR